MKHTHKLVGFIALVAVMAFAMIACDTTVGPEHNPPAAEGVTYAYQGPLAAHPANPNINWIYYNTIDKRAYIWDGIDWRILVQDGVDGNAADIDAEIVNGVLFINGEPIGTVTGANGTDGDTPWICVDGFWHIGGEAPNEDFDCNADCLSIPATGIPGIQGEQGERGEQGIQGEQGERGEQGIQGEQGEQGEQGIQGEQGERGEQGLQGEQGEQGERGEQGIQGEQGEQGERGEQGLQGEQGERGEQGDPGTRITVENCVLVFDGIPSSIPAHTFPNAWTPTRAPTCTRVGLETRTCTGANCTVTETRTVAALEHDWSNDWTLVTSPVITGEEAQTCNRCGAEDTRPAPATPGLTFSAIDGGTAFAVARGTATAAIVIIPAEHNGQPVTQIANGGFYFYTAMTGIFIPASVTTIGNFAFQGCTALTSINVDAANPNYASVNGVLYNKALTELIQAPGGISGSFTIPDSVTSIGTSAFQNCRSLTSITIPNSVTSIGQNAFAGCIGLTSITIPANVTTIDNSTFRGCTGLTSITIPASVTRIGWDAFSGCTALTSITIPDSVTTIGNSAFSNCSALTSITIPASVTSIDWGAFSNCTSLTSITIPASVTSIGNSAFFGCSALTSINVDAANPNYASVNGVLYNKTVTELIQAPGGISGSFTIPASVTNIGSNAFAGCNALTSVTIPASVESIGILPFMNCNALTSITIERTAAAGIPTLELSEGEHNPFDFTSPNLRIEVPAGDVAAYKAGDIWSDAAIVNRIHATGCTNTNNPCGVNCE